MNAKPEIGAKVWALRKRGDFVDAVPVTVVGISRANGDIILRWERPGMEVEFKRKPGHVWSTEEEARDALWKLRGPWRRLGGVQMDFFTRGEGRG